MKKNRLFLFSVFLISAWSLSVFGQTTYSFCYDASGNRNWRCIDLLKGSTVSNESEVGKIYFETDIIGDNEIKIFPNPTKGRLKIETSNNVEIPVRLSVYSANGSLIKSKFLSGSTTEIDLSDQANGTYILTISIGELNSQWKIIKN